MRPEEFVALVAGITLPDVFNPYADVCRVHDQPNAPELRRQNLEAFLKAALTQKVRTIWIARDLGYRGGRRTGVPLTDEPHLPQIGHLLGGINLRRATRGPAVAERTASVVWSVLDQIQQPVVLWNVFPLHPHEPDDEFSNRCHTRSEREATQHLLKMLVKMFRAERLVAIGRDAHIALQELSTPVSAVRHPSYGGQREFVDGLLALYGVGDTTADLFNRH
jgi:hypothetical protein